MKCDPDLILADSSSIFLELFFMEVIFWIPRTLYYPMI